MLFRSDAVKEFISSRQYDNDKVLGHFMFITKRIDRLQQCLPPDWGDGYDNVTICCTMENQDRVDYRLPIYKESPIKHKIIICEPLLSQIDFRGELEGWVEQVVAGGESGKEARVCN